MYISKIDWIEAQKVKNPPHTGLALTGSTCALHINLVTETKLHWEIQAIKWDSASAAKTAHGQFGLAVRPRGAESLGQIALGAVLPLAWLPGQISLGKFGCTGLV